MLLYNLSKKSFFSAKGSINWVKRQPQNCKKTKNPFWQLHEWNWVKVCCIQRIQHQLNIMKTHNTTKEWSKNWTMYFWMKNTHSYKIYLQVLKIPSNHEMQIKSIWRFHLTPFRMAEIMEAMVTWILRKGIFFHFLWE